MVSEAIIFATDRKKKLSPLNDNKPNSLLEIAGKTILEWQLSTLDAAGIRKATVVIEEDDRNLFDERIGRRVGNVQIRYELNGENKIATLSRFRGKFLVIRRWYLFTAKDIKKMLKEKAAILVADVEDHHFIGKARVRDGKLKKLLGVVQRKYPVDMGVYVLPETFFEYAKELHGKKRTLHFQYALSKFAEKHEVKVVFSEQPIPIIFPWDLLKANEEYMKKIRTKISKKATIEKNVIIKGPVVIEDDVIIKAGTYIEGPCYIKKGTHVGPYAYLRKNVFVSEKCRIGSFVEIKNSLIYRNTYVPHLSYVGDSILGERVNIGGSCVISNLRHDGRNIRVLIDNQLIDTKRRKFGAVIGDDSKLGVGTVVNPGMIIKSNVHTAPGTTIIKNRGRESSL